MTAEQPPSLEQASANLRGWGEHYRAQVAQAFAQAQQIGTPDGWRGALEFIRAQQDALEEYVSVAVLGRGTATRFAAEAKAEYDSKWAGQAGDNHRQGGSTQDMEGPRERYARFDLAAFSELRAWRQAEQARLLAEETLEDLLLRYRGINATREDIHQILRAYAFARSLEQ